MLLLIGCRWQNGLCHRLYSPLRLQAVFTGASYLRSRGTNDHNMRDGEAAVILPGHFQACWTEIMASRPVCRLRAGPAKLPELSLMITAREHWPRTVTIMTHLRRTNEAVIGRIMWPPATASRVHCVSLMCFLSTAANTDEGNHLSRTALLTKRTNNPQLKKSPRISPFITAIQGFSRKQTISLSRVGVEVKWV